MSRRLRVGASRPVGALLAVALGLSAVSGCGTRLTPGVAATINETTISQDRVDSVVQAACEYTAANAAAGGQAGAPVSLANLRSTITQALIQFAVTDEAATAMGLSVSEAAISAGAEQNTIPESLDDDADHTLKGFFEEFARSSAQGQLIGAHLSDPSITTFDEVTADKSAQASSYLKTFVAKQDITVNPAYGRWTGSAVVGGSGSLSDPVSDIAKASQAAASDPQASTSDLPASQVC
ncbi:MAG: SurA N-terminal domain-containing protein [Propionibacteriales bacterium]|nr:SurA N-terminal domain-containing protein [Propionibacteriales bacterium]